jgi:hypothetical protein
MANRSRPKWALTNTNWEIRKIIWQRLALGESKSEIKKYLELNADKYPPLDRSTIANVEKEFTFLPHELLARLLNEIPDMKSYILEKRPDFEVSPTQSNTLIGANPKLVREVNKALEHDIIIYKKSSDIISDERFRKLCTFLNNTCFSKSQMRRIEIFIRFFNQEANTFIDMNLRHSSYKFCIGLEKLLDFMGEYSCEYVYWERLIIEGKVKPPTNWQQFDDIVTKENDVKVLSGYESEWFYILMEEPGSFDFFEALHPKSTLPYQIPTHSTWKQSLDYLISDCESFFKEYRSCVRDLLYI